MGFGISASGIQASLQRLATISQNVANAVTPGFRSRRTEQAALAGRAGVASSATTTTATPGPPVGAADGLNAAILGDGLFLLRDAAGDHAFTRTGVFGLNANGQLVTTGGHLVEPGIQVPTGTRALRIGRDGTVAGIPPGGTDVEVFGRLQAARFANPAGLADAGANTLLTTAASGPPRIGTFTGLPDDAVVSGFVEGSNVELSRELTDQLLARRDAQANLNAFRAQDDFLGTLIDLLR